MASGSEINSDRECAAAAAAAASVFKSTVATVVIPLQLEVPFREVG